MVLDEQGQGGKGLQSQKRLDCLARCEFSSSKAECEYSEATPLGESR